MKLELELAGTSSSSVIQTYSSSSSNSFPAFAPKWNRKCKEFRNKGLEHFDMLVQLFKTGTASSAQPDSPDDVDEIPHPDMGQGSNRKGKLPIHSNTSTKKKRKAIDSIIETEFSKKRHCEDRTVESLYPYSIAKATEIVNSMFGGPLGRSTLFKFLLMLKTPTLRETFITLQADMREAFIEYCCGSN